jgi:uncharacterized protein
MDDSIEQLGPQHAESLRSLLAKDTPHNLFLLGLSEECGLAPREDGPGCAFHGRFKAEGLVAVVFVDPERGLVVPSASDPAEIAALGAHLAGRVTLRSCVGEQLAVEALVRHLCPTQPTSIGQRLFSVSADDLGPFTNPTLRLAREDDLPRLLPLAAGAVKESLGRDPLSDDPQGFPERVLQRVRGGRCYVLEVEGELVFKVDIGSRSRFGAELEGVFTAPGHRGRGHATLSLGQISRQLLASLPRLSMRVHDQDQRLADVVRKVGFVPGRPQRLVTE